MRVFENNKSIKALILELENAILSTNNKNLLQSFAPVKEELNDIALEMNYLKAG